MVVEVNTFIYNQLDCMGSLAVSPFNAFGGKTPSESHNLRDIIRRINCVLSEWRQLQATARLANMRDTYRNHKEFARNYFNETFRENSITLFFVASAWLLFAMIITGEIY